MTDFNLDLTDPDREQENADYLYWFPVRIVNDVDGNLVFEREDKRCMWFEQAVKMAIKYKFKLIGKYTNNPDVTKDEFMERFELISLHNFDGEEIFSLTEKLSL